MKNGIICVAAMRNRRDFNGTKHKRSFDMPRRYHEQRECMNAERKFKRFSCLCVEGDTKIVYVTREI